MSFNQYKFKHPKNNHEQHAAECFRVLQSASEYLVVVTAENFMQKRRNNRVNDAPTLIVRRHNQNNILLRSRFCHGSVHGGFAYTFNEQRA